MSSCLKSWGLCGRAYQLPGARRAGTRKSRAPSGVDRVSVGVSISTKSRAPEDPAGRGVDLRAEPDRVPRGVRPGPAQVEVAVLEAGLLADGHVAVDLERQRRARVEDLESFGDHLDLAGRQVEVGVALGSAPDVPGDLDDELVAQLVRAALGEDLVPRDDLDDARAVAQVDEGDPAVIAPLGHPPGEGDGERGSEMCSARSVPASWVRSTGDRSFAVVRVRPGRMPRCPVPRHTTEARWAANRHRPRRGRRGGRTH